MKIALYILILKNIIILDYPHSRNSLLEKRGLFKILQKNTKTFERTIDWSIFVSFFERFLSLREMNNSCKIPYSMIHNFREMQGCRPFILFDSPFRDTTKIDRLFSIKSFYRTTMVSIARRIEIHWTWRARRIRMHSGTKPKRGEKEIFSWKKFLRF